MEIPRYNIRGTNNVTNRRKIVSVRAFTQEMAIAEAERKGISQPYEVEFIPPDPATRAQIDYASSLGIPIPMNATKQQLSLLLDYCLTEDIDFSKLAQRKPTGLGWKGWDSKIHTEQLQIAKQHRAKSAQYEPVALYPETNQGAFAGASTGYYYLTGLEECECPDFIRNAKPCKHMYRLAHELGYLSLENTRNAPTKGKNTQRYSADAPKINYETPGWYRFFKYSGYATGILLILFSTLLLFAVPIAGLIGIAFGVCVVLHGKNASRKLKLSQKTDEIADADQ